MGYCRRYCWRTHAVEGRKRRAMPRRDKCDVCRARKVKCDAVRPSCQACLKGGRPCSYSDSNEYGENLFPSYNDGLQLTSSRRASTGTGAFYTLSLRNASLSRSSHSTGSASPLSPSPPLGNGSTQLAARWTHLMEFDLREVGRLSDCTEIFRMVPAMIGHDFVLDATARYTIDTYRAFLSQSEEDLSVAKRSSVEAMRAMRFALSNLTLNASDAIMISMYAMSVAELMVGIKNFNHRYHVLALCQTLKERWTSGRWGVLEQRLIRAVHLEECLDSFYSGTVSTLDDVSRLLVASTITSEEDELDQCLNSTMDQLIELPRLSMLLREALQSPEPTELISRAVTLAVKLNSSKHLQRTEELIAENTFPLEVDSTDFPAYLLREQPINFTSNKIFQLAVSHHVNRLVLCRVLQKLTDLIHDLFDSATATIAADFAMSADFITRSIPYALAPSNKQHWNILRLFSPVIQAYGAWNRLEELATWDVEATATDATVMKNYCERAWDQMAAKWRWQMALADLAPCLEAWTGGATLPWFSMRANGQPLLVAQPGLCGSETGEMQMQVQPGLEEIRELDDGVIVLC